MCVSEIFGSRKLNRLISILDFSAMVLCHYGFYCTAAGPQIFFMTAKAFGSCSLSSAATNG